jgi:nucleotidyltransferase/DNA polymerase involved in DNA repair
MSGKEVRKKSEDKRKSLQNKTNKEEDSSHIQECIERLRELLKGKFL